MIWVNAFKRAEFYDSSMDTAMPNIFILMIASGVCTIALTLAAVVLR